MLRDGVSEFTFAGLYLFRDTYKYRIARLPGGGFVVSGIKLGEPFFFSPCGIPSVAVLHELLKDHAYMKNMSVLQCGLGRIELESAGFRVVEDRDNFDYVYAREDLAELSGKPYHKKRNLVNAFINSYSCEQKPLSRDNVAHAIDVLDAWRVAKGIDGDYAAAREALERHAELHLRGMVWYVEGASAAYALGEPVARGRMFAMHFEKAVETYKGIYQFINQAYAQALPKYIRTINREQDLGDEGLRQAKMTYRPSGFVEKYRVYR
jgi:hypothetical protein